MGSVTGKVRGTHNNTQMRLGNVTGKNWVGRCRM